VSLDTYANLQTEIAEELNRDDLSTKAQTFIALAEAQMNRDIRHWRMEKRDTLSASGQYTQRPTDWLETIRLWVTGSGTTNLQLSSMATMADRREAAEDAGGAPKYYAHVEDDIELYPSPDDTYTLGILYYQKIPALSDSNTTNWLLTNHPDVYFYGALLHSAPYLQEDARITVWAQLYSAAVANLNAESDRAKMSGSGLKLKIRGLG